MMRRRDLLSGVAAGSVMALGGRLAFAEPVTITFLHCNDVYEIGPKPGKGGGFAPFMSLLEVERRRTANSITTFGGDLISPSVLSGLTKGQQMIELSNAIGIEVAVLGNHEFDFGPEVAKERIGQSHYPWLGTNVLGKDGQPAVGTHDLKLMTVAGYKIGFFGVLTPETAQLSSPGPDITFADPVETATKAVAELKGMGADMIVAMTHLDIADDRALAAKVKGIDLILGGHDHEPITFDEGSTLIIKAGYDLHYLAVVDVTIERVQQKGKEVVAWRPAWRYVPTEGVKPQPQIQAIVARWEKKLDEDLGQPVGVTSVELDTQAVERAHRGDELRRSRRRRHPARDRLGHRHHQWRRHPWRQDLRRRDADHAQGHHDRAALRQRHGGDRPHGQRRHGRRSRMASARSRTPPGASRRSRA